MGRYTVTVHERGRRTRDLYDDLDAALDGLAAEVLGRSGATRAPARVLSGEVAPSAQVVARIEIRGPRAAGGVDLRGDGTAAAFSGRWVRRAIEPEGRETAAQALRRVLGPG